LETADANTFGLLKLFTFGTLPELKGKNLKLTDTHRNKMKRLTVISLASEKKQLSYEELQKNLEVSTVRELEDFLIDCLYQGFISGKLDHNDKILVVEHCISRDLKPHQIEEMFTTLQEWCTKSEALLGAINKQIQHSQATHQQASIHKKDVENKVESVKLAIKLQNESQGMAGISDHMLNLIGDHMELEDKHKKSRKKKGKGFVHGA